MTTIPQPADLTADYTATYDAWNRMVKVEDGANTVAEYEYDGLNRRIVKVDKTEQSEVTYDYYLNEQWQTLELRKDGDVDPYEQNVWHPYYVDALLLRDYDEDIDGTSLRHYYTHDANFNITAVTDDAGAVVERYHYTPYGAVVVLDADFSDDADGASDISNPVTFTGRRHDPETGLYYYRNRYYHAQIGRFITRDPVGYVDSAILLLYALSTPVSLIDPFGLRPRPPKPNPDPCLQEYHACMARCNAWLKAEMLVAIGLFLNCMLRHLNTLCKWICFVFPPPSPVCANCVAIAAGICLAELGLLTAAILIQYDHCKKNCERRLRDCRKKKKC